MYKTKSRHRNINMKSIINTISTIATSDFISVTLLVRLASLRTDFIVYTQLSFEKDGEALRKFLHFDTKVNIMHGKKAGKTPSLFVVCCSEFVRL